MSDETRGTAADGDAVWTAAARQLAGEGTAEERDAFRREAEAFHGREALLASLDAVLMPLARDARPDVDVEAALAAVLARRDAGPRLVGEPAEAGLRAMASPPSAADREGEAPARVLPGPDARPRLVEEPRAVGSREMASPPSIARPARWRMPGWLAAAALVVVTVGGALMLWRPSGPAVHVETQAYVTSIGATRAITLPDGSRVQLGPDSRLDVLAGYGGGARAVRLWGEAYFDVRHDAAHPFVVRTVAAEVRDLGTTFTVRTEGDSGARVAVTSGSVALAPASGDAEAILRAGDRGRVDSAGALKVERGTAGDDDVAWTKGRLVFRDAPVPQVAEELRRWYGITLVVRDPALAGRHLTASFGGESADQAVAVVAAALGGQLQRRGDTAAVVPAGP